MKNYYQNDKIRLDLVKEYLSVFKAVGNLPTHERMMQDIRALDEYISQPNIDLDSHQKGL